MQTIAILGSTGSIGTQALELVRLHPEEFRVVALTARSSREKLFEQVREFRPEVAGLTEPIPMSEIPGDVRFCRWVMGEEALHAAAAEVPADMVLVSVVGIAGLQSVMDALGANRQVLLANKEALVTGGHLVMDAAKRIGKPMTAGSDAHSPHRIGEGYLELPDDLATWQEVLDYIMHNPAPIVCSNSRHLQATLRYGIKSIGEWLLRGCKRM